MVRDLYGDGPTSWGGWFARFVGWRLVWFLLAFLAWSCLCFSLFLTSIRGYQSPLEPDEIFWAFFKDFWKLDQPVWVQFAVYLRRMLTFDLGLSVCPSFRLVSERIGEGAINTLVLLALSFLFCFPPRMVWWSGRGGGRGEGEGKRRSVAVGLLNPLFSLWAGMMILLLLGFVGFLGVQVSSLGFIVPSPFPLFLYPWLVMLTWLLLYSLVLSLSLYGGLLAMDVGGRGMAPAYRNLGKRGVGPTAVSLAVWRRQLEEEASASGREAAIFSSLVVGVVILVERLFDWHGIGWTLCDSLVWHDIVLVNALLFFMGVVVMLVRLLVEILWGVGGWLEWMNLEGGTGLGVW